MRPSIGNENVEPEELEKHILSTYLTLRMGLVTIAIAFPFVLAVGGYLYADLDLQDSLSAYYHAGSPGRSMRDWFVGLLFTVGVSLYLYKGYTDTENILLNTAGILCVGIAIFPMPWEPAVTHKLTLHGFCAVTFFLCIAAVCLVCADDTLPLIRDSEVRRRFARMYKAIGAAMVISPAAAYVFTVILRHNNALTFFTEAFGIFAFAGYWITKSREISMTAAEERAARGQLAITAGKAIPAQ